MINLANEKKRLAEFEVEYERKKNEYGGQMILGQVIELRRIVALLEKAERERKFRIEVLLNEANE